MLGLLLVTQGPEQGREFVLAEGKTLLIGRGQDTVTQFTDPHVARHHCQVHCQAGKALLSDSGSIGGTWVNGKRITEHELQPGDAIRIGRTQLWFRWVAPEELSTACQLPPIET